MARRIVSVDPAVPGGDYSCKVTAKIKRNGVIKILKIEYPDTPKEKKE